MTKTPLQRDGKIDIKSLDYEGFAALMTELGESEIRTQMIYDGIWKQGVKRFFDIEGVSKKTLRKLDDIAFIDFLSCKEILESKDGTRKFLWHMPNNGVIESVLIPDIDREDGAWDRLTLCISSQVGCAMKCSFCLTGDMGLKRNLTAAQIANQALQVGQSLPEDKRITNIVMMGMGEPLHNYNAVTTALRNMLHEKGLNFSHRRITVSTVGIVNGLKKLAEELPVNLAISLNASTETQRMSVMPITKKWSMAELVQTCREIPVPTGKKIAFEYVMMAGFNDSIDDAERLLTLLGGVPAKVNLIPYNENPHRDIKRPSDQVVKSFQHHLVINGLFCTIRKSRGRDISAACGQLGLAKEKMKPFQRENQYA